MSNANEPPGKQRDDDVWYGPGIGWVSKQLADTLAPTLAELTLAARACCGIEELPPPKPDDPHIRRTCRGRHWGGFRGNRWLTDCLFTLDDGARWIARGAGDEQW